MNNNIFNSQNQNGYYQYPYQAGIGGPVRPEVPNYMMPQTAAPQFIKGRPVSSFEEARVAQIDLDGSIFLFPDLGNKRIYTKRINPDGTATIQSYFLEAPVEESKEDFATRQEVVELKEKLESIIAKLQKDNVKLNF